MSIQGLEFVDHIAQMPLLDLPVRTVVAAVPTGKVMLSPGSKMTEFGSGVTDIVAPTLLHLGGLAKASKALPQARVWGTPGCREKQKDVTFTHILGVDAWPHADAMPWYPIEGMPKVAEGAFLHRASRTLLVCDFVFNITDAKGPGAWLLLHAFGTYRKLGVSRFFMQFVKDKPAFDASVAKIAALDFDHIVPTHGQAVMNDGRSKLIAALQERGLRG